MDIGNRKQTVFNMGLARFVSLYQHLNPHSTRIRGYNFYHITNVFFGSLMVAISMSSSLGLYYSMNDINSFMFYMGCIINLPFSCYKMFTIIYYAKDLWMCSEIGNRDFLSYQHYNKCILKRWQRRTTIVSYVLITIAILALSIWITSPHVFHKTIVTIRTRDGLHSKYRMNIYNLYFMYSVETYSKYFNVFYPIEFFLSLFFIYFTVLFDILMVFMCFSISSQLETISDGISSLGHYRSKNNFDIDDSIQYENEPTKIHDLKIMLQDHIHVIKTLKDYNSIVRPVVLSQLITVSTSLIVIWFIAAMCFSGDNSGDYILSLKMFTLLPVFMFQLFMTCHLYGTIDEKKESITYALYSCNWTMMNMKSKKLILYAMKMNRSQRATIKFTNIKIINLEMFTIIMRICYSIFSMLIKYNINN